MGFTLSKSFRFESAHRMAKGYVGKCANIHGHSWNGEIAISCEALDECDMGIDYKDIGKFLHEHVEGSLDHKLLLYRHDEVLTGLAVPPASLFLFSQNPTSECIAKWIYERAIEYFSKQISEGKGKVRIEYVQVNETCTSSCRYTGA